MNAANTSVLSLAILLSLHLPGYSQVQQSSPTYQLNIAPGLEQPVKRDTNYYHRAGLSIWPYAGNQALVNIKPQYVAPNRTPKPKPEAPRPRVVPGIPNSKKMIEILRGRSLKSQLSPTTQNQRAVNPPPTPAANILDRVVRINPKALPKGMGLQTYIKKSESTIRIRNGQAHVEKHGNTSHHLGHTYPPGSYQAGNPKPTPSIAYRVDSTSQLSTNSVKFKKGSIQLADHESYLYLQNLANALLDPWLHHERFVIEGHASAEGSDASNLVLSQRRANAIYDFMVERGVRSHHLLAVGHGEYFARYSHRDPEYLRAQDRQVMVFKLAE